MKDTIIICGLRDMIIDKYGKSAWDEVLETSGLPKDTVFSPTENAPAETVLKVLNNLCKTMHITVGEVTDAFGEYWVSRYAPKLQSDFDLWAPNSKEFLLKLNEIHCRVIESLEEDCPPKFFYSWNDEDTLMLTYNSKWDMMPFFIGLVKGIGRYYNEDLSVNMWSQNQILVKFPAGMEQAGMEQRQNSHAQN